MAEDLAQYVIEHIQSDIDECGEDRRRRVAQTLSFTLDDFFICYHWYQLNPDKDGYSRSIWNFLNEMAQVIVSHHGEIFHQTKKAALVMFELWERRDVDSIRRVVEYAETISQRPLQHADCYKKLLGG